MEPPQPSQLTARTTSALLAEVLAGAGLGLLVGVLLGLSVEATVGKIIGALIGLLGAFLGLSQSAGPDRNVRIGTFGLVCVAGLVAGLAIRANSLLTPSIGHDVDAWVSAGADRTQAVAFVAFERLGVKPPSMELVANARPDPTATVLYAGDNVVCNEIDGMSVDDKIRTLRGKAQPYPQIAAAAAASPDKGRFLNEHLKCGG